MAINEAKLNEFMGRFVQDFGAVMHGDARYLREWLSAQSASAYVCYDPGSERFSMTEEQAFALAEKGCPALIPGVFQMRAGRRGAHAPSRHARRFHAFPARHRNAIQPGL
ncbi:hypothetical protein SAMN05216344_101270 [Polaromonas sp. OV174]|nr:hypothetical protein [Polaromonas sp. OV174]SFB69269.1 hypothetical protein SAMN05216344_101270 [Polaromonas sp. OV174]